MSSQGNSTSANGCFDISDLQNLFKFPVFKSPHKTLSNLLVMDVFGVSQIYIDEVLQLYPTLKDLHDEPPFHAILVHMSLWLASGLNYTLISFINLNLCQNAVKVVNSLPTITGPILSNSLLRMYNIREDQTVSNFKYGLKYPLAMNFIYCSDHTGFERVSILVTLFEKVDSPVWICLGISLAAVTIINAEPTQTTIHFWDSRIPLMATLSVLMTSGPSGKLRRTSVVFVLWMFACLIFVTYYSGSLTSSVISPPREVRLRRMDQLLDRNFSFVFEQQNFPINVAIEAVEFSYDCNSASDEKLLSSLNSAVRETSEEYFLRSLVAGEKRASLVSWPSAIFAANLGNKFISKNGIKRTRCFIGEELLHPIDYHYGFTGYGNEKLARVAEAMEESGFYALWWEEFFGLATSTRVQSRSKLVNPTKYQVERKQVGPLQLEGKLIDVFLLWVKCLAGAFAVFIAETTKVKLSFCLQT